MAGLSVAGRIYANGGLREAILHIDQDTGRIEKVARTVTADEHIDFGDKVLLPGAIDMHVHFREPGLTQKEDFGTGTVAAAFGGVTAIVDMPNTAPPTTTFAALRSKLEAAREKCVVDYGAWSGATWFLGDLPQMLQHSAGVKVFLGATTGDLLLDELDRLGGILQNAAAAKRPVVLHAEADRVLESLRRNESNLMDHHLTRPAVAEVEAIYDVMKVMAGLRTKPIVHVAHAASAEAVHAAASAGFSAGVCPHHLLLDVEQEFEGPEAYRKVNPPLRPAEARKALWTDFIAGKIPIIESDHAPHTRVEKDDNFHAAPAGLPGVETMVPLLLAKAAAGDVPLATVVEGATKGPAALLGLSDRGILAKGMRADFAVYDLGATEKIEAGNLHSRCKWTPYEGHDAIFPSDTFVGGQPVVRDLELVAPPGSASPLWPVPGDG